MKYILRVTLLLLLLTGCGGPGRPSVTPVPETFAPVYENRHAGRFELLQGEHSRMLRVFNPWQGADSVVMEYRFVADTVAEAYRAGAIRYPVERAVCMSSSYVAFLDAAGAGTSVVGVSGLGFLTNEAVRATAGEVGYDGNLNYELIVSLRPDVVFMYGVEGANSAVAGKLEQLGIPVVYIADYLENDPLGRAEWIVPFGFITGRMEQAQALFLEVEENYQTLGELAAGSMSPDPKVMLNSPYRDVWYLPGDRNYMVRLLEDAGGIYLGAGEDSDVSRPVSSEQALTLMMQADYWLNPGMAQSMKQLREENRRFGDLPVVRAGKVYNNNARITEMGGSDFWESGAVRPDIVLADLVRIFHPEVLPGHRLYYYRKLE